MSTPNTERYFVDERGGCIAVRDRWNTNEDEQGLHQGQRGVVAYWHGSLVDVQCPCCKHVAREWSVSARARAQAILKCAELNAVAAAEFSI